jgi:hypothetical protein
MIRCIRCHRPMKHASDSGMGPRCFAVVGKPVAAVDRDLFGYDVPAAASAAIERLRVCIESLALKAVMAVRHEAAAARRRLGVWAA